MISKTSPKTNPKTKDKGMMYCTLITFQPFLVKEVHYLFFLLFHVCYAFEELLVVVDPDPCVG